MYERTNALIREQMQQGVFPGASWAFLDDEKEQKHVEGLAQVVPTKEILRENMLYDMASITKVVCTTSLILKLWEQGEIDLDVPFRRYYPSFLDEKVTVRHLLTHTSDINPWIENREKLSANELKEAFNFLKSGENVGEIVKYTDTGTILLGFLLENIFQMNVQSAFQQFVLDELEMNNSCFQPAPIELSVPTENHVTRGVIRGWTHDPKAFVLGESAGSAGLFSTLDDQIKFVRKVFFEQSYLKPATIEKLLHDQTPSGTLARSLGWDLRQNKQEEPVLFHTGFTGTFLLVDVRNQRAFIFLSNRVHPENHRQAYILSREELVAKYFEECEE
ncbi:CubicO group peptidase, beta-lactamase class C family [Pilibacter termitis]|uniref:CubicO group peptidase, beta-lactamase class C family n=1 Tax=Pilibacter termitis TaxID=263852 RepID=A0A1T4NKE6_9ENTE|nr:serine hydrolase domain-containing protein [Pilibacter termitis]SJZ79546.1 CubicO group peptidase, beta-lactamase class C family [Pilibacter termitis]